MPRDSGVANPSEPSIAVVVVHGVSDPEPGHSARQIANLLTDLCPLGTYTTFEEQAIRVPVERVEVPKQDDVSAGPFEERNPDALRRHHGHADSLGPADIAFMADQLRKYEPEADVVFETTRLKGLRNTGGVHTHVYEAYWADLSRLGTGFFAFFDQAYQLLLHLPSLGRNALDYARAAYGTPSWRLLSRLQRWSIRLLTLLIAVLNVTLAGFVLPALVPRLLRFLNQGQSPVAMALALGVLSGCFLAGAGVLVHTSHFRSRKRWLGTLVLPVLVGVLVGLIATPGRSAAKLLTFEAWLLSAVIVGMVLHAYDRMRPGSCWIGGSVVAFSAVWFMVFLSQASTTEGGLVWAVLQPIALIDGMLALAWRAHALLLLVTIVTALVCWRREQRYPPQAKHTVWTALFSLSLTTALFANLTLAVWSALFRALGALLPSDRDRIHGIPDWILNFLRMPRQEMAPADLIQEIILTSGSTTFVVTTCLVAAFVVAAVWALFPAILSEARPRSQASSPDRMRALGEWLSRGLDLIPQAGVLFPLAFALIVPAFVALSIWICPTCFDASGKAALTAGGLVIALFGARFWLPGASAALDVLLDVDNHLRQHPKNRTPRARIAARYTSLLSFILDPDRNGGYRYDAIVIVAHSQGAAITTDLLRFLSYTQHRVATALARQPLMVFTMGNPSRLYARAFPWLYEWLWNTPGSGGKSFGPDPGELGVTRWVNGYRTGDYVGRFLWQDDKDSALALQRRETGDQAVGDPTIRSLDSTRQEFCMGEGAHTHYWDRHGSDTAWMLDRLIVDAMSQASSTGYTSRDG